MSVEHRPKRVFFVTVGILVGVASAVSAQVGVFSDAVEISQNPTDGCLGEDGEWFADYDAGTDSYNLGSMGGDVWQGGDNMTFVYNPLQGDFVITAHIVQFQASGAEWGKIGVMARQDLSPTSRHNWTFEPTFFDGRANGASQTAWGGRTSHGVAASAFNTQSGANPEFDWIRLQRTGNVIVGLVSETGADGTWAEIPPTSSMDWGAGAPDSLFVGIMVCSNLTDCSVAPATVTFDNVSLGGDVIVVPGPAVRDITLSGDDTTCPPTGGGGPVTVTLRQDRNDGDPAAIVRVRETISDVTAADVTNVSNGGTVDELTGSAPVGDFQGRAFLVDDGAVDCPFARFAEYDDATGEYHLGSLGGDTWQSGDTMTFVYNQVRGDFILDTTPIDHAAAKDWGKYGLMVRQDLTTDSRHSWVFEPLFLNQAPHDEQVDDEPGDNNQTAWGGRAAHGVASSANNTQNAGNPHYARLRIERLGTEVIGYGSDDGIGFFEVGRMDWGLDAPETVLVGLQVTSDVTSCDPPLGPTNATFGDVELILGVGAEIVPVEGGGDVIGVGISWDVTRAELDAGVSYTLDVDSGVLDFEGKAGPRDIEGPASVTVLETAPTVYGPFPSFGTGIIRGHAIGLECAGTEVDLDGGNLTMIGAGQAIGDSADHFLFAYDEVAGDFSARVTIASRGPASGAAAKYGLMVRQDCGTSTRHLSVLEGANGITNVVRRDQEISDDSVGGSFDTLRIDRVGDTFTAHVFDTGTWREVSSTAWVDAPGTLLVGLAATSGTEDRETACDVLQEVAFSSWEVDTAFIPASPPVRAVTTLPQDVCPPAGGSVDVTVEQPLDGAGAADPVTVREQARGRFSAVAVTATNSGVVADLTPGDFQNVAFIVDPSSGVDCSGGTGQGFVSYDTASQAYTLGGMGGDVWVGGDTTTFAHTQVRGDFSLSARVVARQTSSDWGKLGVMVRQDLTSTSRYGWVFEPVFTAANPLEPLRTDWGWRPLHANPGTSCNNDRPAPCNGENGGGNPFYGWIRIERTGNEIIGSGSNDGVNYVEIGRDVWDVDPPDTVFAGLQVSSNSTDCSLPATTAVFSDVEISLEFGGEIVPPKGDPTPLGVEISWDVTRGDLAGGVGYSIADSGGSVSFAGAVGTAATTGDRAVAVLRPPSTLFGPFPTFGDGLTNGHMIGADCDTANVTLGDGELEMVGAGGDIAGASADNFLFAYKEVTGDFSASVTVPSHGTTFPAPTAASRFGIMARQSCDPNARLSAVLDADPFFHMPPDSLAPAGFFRRNTHLGTDSAQTLAPGNYNEYRLDRQGNELIGFYRDGGDWIEIDRMDWGAAAPATLFVGLAVVAGPGAFDGPCSQFDVTFEDWLVVSEPVGTQFRRGDANADGATNLADAVATFNFLFLGGDEPTCLDAADSNDTDNALNLTDGVFLLNFLFLGGDPIPDPGPFDCGPEPDGSPFTFGCETYAGCGAGG